MDDAFGFREPGDRQRTYGPSDLAARGAWIFTALLVTAGWIRTHPAGTMIRGLQVRPAAADLETLASLPGAGLPLARRIVAYREIIAPFESAMDLRRVPGIGVKRLHQWSLHLHLEAR